MTIAITPENFPAAFAAMDAEASSFWTYPDAEWQDAFLYNWAEENDLRLLKELIRVRILADVEAKMQEDPSFWEGVAGYVRTMPM